jgi:heme/copper-type cytochrome/quinol oxidase subunit 3
MNDARRHPPPEPGGTRREIAHVLPAAPHGPHLSWWGAILGLIAVGMIQSAMLFAYAFLSAQVRGWPPAGVPRPGLLWPTVATGVLLVSLLPAAAASRAARSRSAGGLQAAAVLTALLGVAHLGIQAWTYTDLPMSPTQGAYGSVFVLTLAIHHLILAAPIVGFAILAVQVWDSPGERQQGGARALALWWQVTTAYWLLVYGTLYLSPLVLGGGGG